MTETDTYGSLQSDAVQLRRWINPGDTIVWGQGPGAPLGLISSLLGQRHELGGVSVFCGLSVATGISAEHTDAISFRSYGSQGDLRGLARAGLLEIVPCHMSHLPWLLRTGRLPSDVVFVQLAPADSHGWHSLGVGVQHLPAALDSARIVLAEVNDRMPVTHGSYRIHESRLDAKIQVSRPLAELPAAAFDERNRGVAERVAALVPDDATIQAGVGSLPGAVFALLKSRRGLRIHTGLVTDTLLDLAEAGALADSTDRPSTVTSAAFGTQRLYDYLDGRSDVAIESIDYTHSPEVLAAIDGFVAINSALEVDVLGQVGSEVISNRYVGAQGGQLDFGRAATRSRGGMSIIALSSVAGHGGTRIVPRLHGPASMTRADVDHVVTEHGVADLRGLTETARAEAIIAVADPQYRTDLHDAFAAMMRARAAG